MRIEDVVGRAPTARAALPTRWQDREAVARRVGVVLLVVVVALAAVGVLGPRTRTTSSTSGDVSVTHPSTTRRGLDSTVSVTIRPRASAEDVVIRLDRSAFETLGIESVVPEPTSMVSRGDAVEMAFEGDGQRPVVVSMHGRVPTQQEPGSHAWTLIRVVDGRPSTITARTWVLP